MITFTNINTFIGSPNFLPKFQKTQQWQFSDTLSWTRGKHQFKFGADVHAPQTNNFQDVPGLRGALNFDKIFTASARRTINASPAPEFRTPISSMAIRRPQCSRISSKRIRSGTGSISSCRTISKCTPQADLEPGHALRFLVAGLGG